MTFVFVKSISARDDSAGIEIVQRFAFRDGSYTFPCVFKQRDLQFEFDVIYSSAPYPYIAKNGIQETNYVTDAVYIIESSLRRNLSLALHKLGKPEPAESEYQQFKNIIAEGISIICTRGGETIKDIPGGMFKVEFEDTIKSFIAKHPDHLEGPRAKRPKDQT